jgi:hypothetical protein
MQIEVRIKLAIEAEPAVERRRHLQRIVVGQQQLRLRLDGIGANQNPSRGWSAARIVPRTLRESE